MRVDTVDGTAEEGTDYRGVHDTFVFQPFQTEVKINLEIMDDDEWEPDEEFFLKISLLPNSEASGVVKIGKRHIMTIKILNDDLPGTFQFEKRAYFVKESCGKAEIIVIREIGADGDVEVGTGYRVQSREYRVQVEQISITGEVSDQRQDCQGRQGFRRRRLQLGFPTRGNREENCHPHH